MKRVLVFTAALFFCISAKAFEGSPTQQVAKFFSTVKSGENAEAVDRLYSSNPLLNQKPQQLAMLKQQLGTIVSLYGNLSGTENIHTEQLSSSLVRIVELAKHEQHPVVWEFYFYKPNEKWFISQGTFNDQFKSIGAKKGM